jgi:hypothetical protein
MSYEDFLSQISLISLTSSGKFKTAYGIKSFIEISFSYFDIVNKKLDISQEEFYKIAFKYCQEKSKKEMIQKFENKEEIRREKLKAKADAAYRATLPQDFDENEIRAYKDHITTLIPFVDSRDAKFHFFDEKSRSVVNVHEKIFISVNGLEGERELIEKSLIGYADFNPLKPEPHYLQEENGKKITILNLCKTPKWLSMDPHYDNIEDGLIFKMILNLFPEAKSREYALCWAYHAITSRNHTYLSLVGARGVGKGMFADLIGQLVGRNYFQKVGDSILEGNFNGQFENNRVLFFDEIVLDEAEKINKLKAYANNHINLEAKGKDARTIRNYTSCIMANNSMSGMQIGPEERRFSIVTIGKKDLRSVLTKKEIDSLVSILETDSEQDAPQEIVNFGHWLLEAYESPEYSNTHTYKEEYFYEVSLNGLAEWKQFLISLFESEYQSEGTIFFKDLKSKYASHIGADKDKVVFPQPKKVQDFLQNYKYRDEFTMGSIIDNKKNPEDKRLVKALRISPEFKEYLSTKNDYIDL